MEFSAKLQTANERYQFKKLPHGSEPVFEIHRYDSLLLLYQLDAYTYKRVFWCGEFKLGNFARIQHSSYLTDVKCDRLAKSLWTINSGSECLYGIRNSLVLQLITQQILTKPQSSWKYSWVNWILYISSDSILDCVLFAFDISTLFGFCAQSKIKCHRYGVFEIV